MLLETPPCEASWLKGGGMEVVGYFEGGRRIECVDEDVKPKQR